MVVLAKFGYLSCSS